MSFIKLGLIRTCYLNMHTSKYIYIWEKKGCLENQIDIFTKDLASSAFKWLYNKKNKLMWRDYECLIQILE